MKRTLLLLFLITAFRLLITASDFTDSKVLYFSIHHDKDNISYKFHGREISRNDLGDIASRIVEKNQGYRIMLEFIENLNIEEFDYFTSVFESAGYEDSIFVGIYDKGRSWHVSLYEDDKEYEDTFSLFESLRKADEVKFKGEIEKKWNQYRSSNREAILDFVQILEKGVYERPNYCLCSGWDTAYFFSDGIQVASVALIHENQIRIHWNGKGGDYEVSPDYWRQLSDAFKDLKSNETVADNP